MSKKNIIENNKILIFELNKKKYGLSTDKIIEITSIDKYTQLPKNKDYTIGLIRIRNKFVELIDFELLLNNKAYKRNINMAILILSKIDFALTIDKIITIEKYNKESILKYKEESILILDFQEIENLIYKN